MRNLWRAFKHVVVVTFCLVGIATPGYYLYYDLVRADDELGKPIGKVEGTLSLVRRKPAEGYFWEPVRAGQLLYRKDSIQTGAESNSTLSLTDGTRLELGENSLVIVDDISLMSLAFMRGSVVLRDVKGQERQLTSSTTGVRERTLRQRLIAPAQSATVFMTTETAKVRFTWKDLSSGKLPREYLRLELSQDKRFRPVETVQFPLNEFKGDEAIIPLAEGKYYWRVQSPSGPTSEWRSFQVKKAHATALIFPTNESRVPARAKFHWRNGWLTHDVPDEILVEISATPAFEKIVVAKSLKGNEERVEIDGLADGPYAWRVRARFNQAWIASHPTSFIIDKTLSLAVEMESPENGALLPRPKEICFQWATEENGPYAFELEKKSATDFTSVFKKESPLSQLLWKDPTSGEFRWRVAGQPWATFTVLDGRVKLASPTESQPLYFWKESPGVTLTWSAEAGATYLVEIADDYRFRAIRKVGEANAGKLFIDDLPSAPSTYFWRVKKLVDGKPTQLSETRSFKFGLHPPLDPVVLKSPADGTTLPIGKNLREPRLIWAFAKDATSYQLSIQSPRGIKKEILKTSSYTIKNFAAGDYTWWVRAVDKLDRLGEPSQKRNFTLHFGPLPPSTQASN